MMKTAIRHSASLFLVTFCLLTFSLTCCAKKAISPEERKIIDQVSVILTTMNIDHEKTLASVTEASQAFRRKKGVERWHMIEPKVETTDKTTILNALKELGLIDALEPHLDSYDAVVVLGATLGRMEKRLSSIEPWLKKGPDVKSLVFLTTQRPLDPAVDNIPELRSSCATFFNVPIADISTPLTETEAAKMLLEISPVNRHFSANDILFIDTPRKLSKGHFERGNTRDSIETWMAMKPDIKRVLLVSNQPHALYQLAASRRTFPKDVTLDIIAGKASSNLSLANSLDAMALWLHNYEPDGNTGN